MDEAPQKLRVDKWLWQARFFKSRSLAGEIAGSGALRIDGQKVAKPSQAVAQVAKATGLDRKLLYARAMELRR